LATRILDLQAGFSIGKPEQWICNTDSRFAAGILDLQQGFSICMPE
jgi:hypothetical protein